MKDAADDAAGQIGIESNKSVWVFGLGYTLWAVFTSDLPFDFFPWIPRSFLTFANQLYKDTTQKSWLDDNRR